MNANELKSLMRKHRVTIRELSQRMGITMKRIREVRRGNGRPLDFLASLDWWQGVTQQELTPRMKAQLKQYINQKVPA